MTLIMIKYQPGSRKKRKLYFNEHATLKLDGQKTKP
jgi:hypothetical protein